VLWVHLWQSHSRATVIAFKEILCFEKAFALVAGIKLSLNSTVRRFSALTQKFEHVCSFERVCPFVLCSRQSLKTDKILTRVRKRRFLRNIVEINKVVFVFVAQIGIEVCKKFTIQPMWLWICSFFKYNLKLTVCALAA
jgi:hypothetical protein